MQKEGDQIASESLILFKKVFTDVINKKVAPISPLIFSR